MFEENEKILLPLRDHLLFEVGLDAERILIANSSEL
jgi:hypothetical protein